MWPLRPADALPALGRLIVTSKKGELLRARQKLNYMHVSGTVSLAAGSYALRGTLELPAGVALEGVSRGPAAYAPAGGRLSIRPKIMRPAGVCSTLVTVIATS